MIELTRSGLVEVLPNRGFRVTVIDDGDLDRPHGIDRRLLGAMPAPHLEGGALFVAVWPLHLLTHKFSDDPFNHRLQLAELEYLTGSAAALGSLAENYVGLPFESAG